ncbi:hypothetical protein BPAE_0064g00160 [Botrytis paeoniae]|uniref:NWD NACHT-NTPase N-terminal domain-containing protein n=1 Tax=Botrytis paeoniae TaxID=278948 RepID=A0A4Z1FSA3_9HELO|nr:hypothetical protein BPAE_0064g00160 [Botrytis paeoniae]
MPIGKRFKRGLSSIKANFKNLPEVLQEPIQSESSVDTTSSVAVSIRKSGESVIQNGKKVAGEQTQELTHDDSTCLMTESLTTTTNDSQLSNEDDLWFQASEKLKADDPELYEQYSLIIRREADKSDEHHPNESAKSLANAATLLKVCQNSLETMNAPSGRADKVFKKTIGIVGLAKDFVGSVVSAEPHGAVAWAGVCLFLPLLLNPSQQDEACRKGLEELPFLIHKLELLKVSSQTYQAVIDIGIESKQRERTKEEMECLQAFRSANLYEEQKDRNPDRVEGTCKWLLESQSFRNWRDGEGSGLLWISADPGCGKSVLSKAFMDERLVSISPATIICHFFFKDISPEQRNPKKAVAALIHQILSKNRHLWTHVIESWKLNGSELCNLYDRMWDILESIAGDPAAGDIICVIDALDECDSGYVMREQFIWRMHRLVYESQPRHMKFVVTSRPYSQIERIFSGMNQKIYIIRIAGEMESEMISQEINLVINHKIAQLDLSERVKNRIITCLQGMSHRTYLWLYLIMDVVRERVSTSGDAEKIEESLRTLPITVEQAYETILNKSPRRSDTEKLLHIIVGAERPLSTDEINIAMNIKVCYNGSQTFEDICLEDSKRYPGMLRNLSLMIISYFNLYEVGKHVIYDPNFDNQELETCKGGYTSLLQAISNTSIDIVQLLIKSGADANYETGMRRPLEDALNLGNLVILRSVVEVAMDERIEVLTVLDMAVINTRRDEFVPIFLDSLVHPMTEGYLETALSFALCTGSIRLIELLLSSGADTTYTMPKGMPSSCTTCLQLSFGLPIDYSEDPKSGKWVCQYGVLKLLLSKAKTLSCEFVKSQLVRCVNQDECDESSMVRSYLNHPRHPGLILDGNRSPIAFAALYAHKDSMEFLLSEPHDVNKCLATILRCQVYTSDGLQTCENGDYWTKESVEVTALVAGVISGSERVVERLIRDGADTNISTELGSPLFVAAAISTVAIGQLLIDNGAQVMPSDLEGREHSSPLVIAAALGNIDIVELLLKSGADVERGTAIIFHSMLAREKNIEGIFYPSAIEAAEMEGHEKVAALLREYRARQAVTGVEEVEVTMMPSRIEEVED